MKKLITLIAASTAFSLIFSTPAQAAAVDYFLKLDGLPGGSDDEVHENEIEALSFQLGVKQTAPISLRAGTGALSAGSAAISPITIVKQIDKSSPLLFITCATGRHIREAVLTCVNRGDFSATAVATPPGEFFIIKLRDVLITSVQTNGAQSDSPEDALLETVTLAFGAIEWIFRDSEGTEHKGGFDFKRNRPIQSPTPSSTPLNR
jgi:type VI secretion system secreted protein Hcp